MFNSRINLNSWVFISLFITCNVHKGTSLQCYQCESNSDGECWSDLSTTLLVPCGDENSTTPNPLTNSTTIAPTTPSTTESTTTSTTESTTPSATASSTESTTPSTTESITTPTTASNTSPTTNSTTESITTPTTASNTSPTINSTTESITTPTTASNTSPTTNSTTESITTSTTASNTSSTTNSTTVSMIASNKSRFRRSVDLRADGAWECVKHIKKKGDEEIVNRKCAKTSEKFCSDKNENSCFACSDKDACNSASSIGFQIISMTLPLTVVFFLAQ
ncbi:uncharacterized protein LOC141536732 isoform X1 [Cotesia typhae]|uniref:uncharacterized protein LOC141536732 isoform X1 n=1 Tax=Cotesia typhae TaxID=2053667 RepID=UPI003D6894D0